MDVEKEDMKLDGVREEDAEEEGETEAAFSRHFFYCDIQVLANGTAARVSCNSPHPHKWDTGQCS